MDSPKEILKGGEIMSKKNLPVNRDERDMEMMEADERTITPRVDIYENDEEFLLVADMPGVSRDTLEVTFEKDSIVISGRKSEPDEQWQPSTVEFSVGRYHRAFKLPSDIDPSRIKAEYDSGVLVVHLPKNEEVKAHKITVKSA